MSNTEKRAALVKIAKGVSIIPTGITKFRIGQFVVHARFCSANPNAPGKFKFNINPNTLSAEYELWVCGSSAIYYLMPTSFIRGIYENPDTYMDYLHPKIRVVSVDTHTHKVMFASGGKTSSLEGYLNGTLP